MTAVDGHEDWWQVTVEADLATQNLLVIFNNKVGNVGTQTGNLTVEANKLYFIKTGGYASFAAAEEAAANPPELPKATLYFYNTDGWDVVNAHMWINGGASLTDWPGKAMTAVDGHNNWFKVEAEADLATQTLMVIFNNKVGDVGTQTGNLTVEANKLYFIKTGGYESFEAAEAVVHTVTFNPNNADEPETWTVKVIDGATVAKPATDPTNENGKAFRYWSDDSGEYNFATPVTEDITLYASYAWKVTYLAGEGATGTIEPQWVKMWTMQGIVLPDATGLSNGDKVFAGWSDGEETYQAGDTYVGTGNHTLTAQWQEQSAQPTTYMVTYLKAGTTTQAEEVVGELPADGEVAVGATITMPTTLSLAYYTLTWRVQKYNIVNGVGGWDTLVTLNSGDEYTMPAHEIRIVATWAKQKVTISFDSNGGDGTMTATTQDYGTALNFGLSKFDCKFTAPDNKEFEGWSNTANGTVLASNTLLDDQIVSAEYTITLYAIWKDVVTSGDPFVTSISGKWTTDGHTVLVATADGNATDGVGNEIVGYVILDGKYLLNIISGSYEGNVVYQAYAPDFNLGYGLSLSESALTLANLYDEGAITLSAKTELSNADRATFIGGWTKMSTSQTWTITATEVTCSVSSFTVSKNMIIGDNLVIVYEMLGSEYVYILAKGETNLEGWYIAPEAEPVAVTFTPAE